MYWYFEVYTEWCWNCCWCSVPVVLPQQLQLLLFVIVCRMANIVAGSLNLTPSSVFFVFVQTRFIRPRFAYTKHSVVTGICGAKAGVSPPRPSPPFNISGTRYQVYDTPSGLSTENRKSFISVVFFQFFATAKRLLKVGFSVAQRNRNRKTDSVSFGRSFPCAVCKKRLHICTETPYVRTALGQSHSTQKHTWFMCRI